MEGPGGYQFVGRTIQMWNPLRETEYFKKGKPWLLNFFDRLKFYPCSADEILKYRDDFLRGKFHIDIEETTFNLGEYKAYLDSIKDSAKKFKEHQEASFQAEHQRWIEQGLDHFESDTKTEDTHQNDVLPDDCEPISATIPGSVWKVLVKEGDVVQKGQQIAVLESMKMEFPVETKYNGTIKKVYVKSSQQIDAGQMVAAIKVEE